MTKELLSSWVTLPVWRDTILLNRLEKGRGGRDGSRKKAGRRRRERLREKDQGKKKWGSMNGKGWEADSIQNDARITNE